MLRFLSSICVGPLHTSLKQPAVFHVPAVVQVLDLSTLADYSDSDTNSEPGSPLRPQAGSQMSPSSASRPSVSRPVQEPVILDPGPEFSEWQAAVDATLQQLEAGIAALAESGRGASKEGGRPTTATTDSRRNAITALRKHTGRLQQLAEQCRQHKAASK